MKTKRIGWDEELQRFSARALARDTRDVLAGKKKIVVRKGGK